MLVLSTKTEDGVQIGDDIRITVIDVRPRNVRIGIEAPKSIAIERKPAAAHNHRAPSGSRPATTPRTSARSANGRIHADHDSTAGMSVLMISRDQPLLSRLKSIIEHSRLDRTGTAASMTEGKRRIAAQQAVDPNARPGLVLLDVDLSPQTAVLFLRWLRQSEPRRMIPVLALRSEATPHSASALLTAGANVVVSKDAPGDRLARSVRAAIELWACSALTAEACDSGHRASLQEHVA